MKTRFLLNQTSKLETDPASGGVESLAFTNQLG